MNLHIWYSKKYFLPSQLPEGLWDVLCISPHADLKEQLINRFSHIYMYISDLSFSEWRLVELVLVVSVCG